MNWACLVILISISDSFNRVKIWQKNMFTKPIAQDDEEDEQLIHPYLRYPGRLFIISIDGLIVDLFGFELSPILGQTR